MNGDHWVITARRLCCALFGLGIGGALGSAATGASVRMILVCLTFALLGMGLWMIVTLGAHVEPEILSAQSGRTSEER